MRISEQRFFDSTLNSTADQKRPEPTLWLSLYKPLVITTDFVKILFTWNENELLKT